MTNVKTADEKSQELFVAKTIKNQMSYDGPFGALGRIAAREFCVLPSDEETQGGLRFRTSIRKPRTRHWIEVRLLWVDVYRVTFWRMKRGTLAAEIVETVDDVYCDMLKDVVENLAEKHA